MVWKGWCCEAPLYPDLLEEMQTTGQTNFRIFETEQAFMTCMLFDLESSQHLHFIDGVDDEFWSAAKEHKVQCHFTIR